MIKKKNFLETEQWSNGRDRDKTTKSNFSENIIYRTLSDNVVIMMHRLATAALVLYKEHHTSVSGV